MQVAPRGRQRCAPEGPLDEVEVRAAPFRVCGVGVHEPVRVDVLGEARLLRGSLDDPADRGGVEVAASGGVPLAADENGLVFARERAVLPAPEGDDLLRDAWGSSTKPVLSPLPKAVICSEPSSRLVSGALSPSQTSTSLASVSAPEKLDPTRAQPGAAVGPTGGGHLRRPRGHDVGRRSDGHDLCAIFAPAIRHLVSPIGSFRRLRAAPLRSQWRGSVPTRPGRGRAGATLATRRRSEWRGGAARTPDRGRPPAR